jgi:hypothetical protein
MFPPSISKSKRYSKRKKSKLNELDIEKRQISSGPNK